MRVADPSAEQHPTEAPCRSPNDRWLHRVSDDLRPAEHVYGARIGFVIEEFNIRDGLRHLKGVPLLFALALVLGQLKHHHQRVTQILQTSRRVSGIYTQRALLLLDVASTLTFNVQPTARITLAERSSELQPPHTLQSW